MSVDILSRLSRPGSWAPLSCLCTTSFDNAGSIDATSTVLPHEEHVPIVDPLLPVDALVGNTFLVAANPFVPARRASANRQMRVHLRRHRAYLASGYQVHGRLPLSADFVGMLKRSWHGRSYYAGSHHVCQRCGASFWYKERFKRFSTERKQKKVLYTGCCSDGKVSLPVYPDCPSPLAELLCFDVAAQSKKFMRLIREYNSMFAFTSLGVHIDKSVRKGKTFGTINALSLGLMK